MGKTRSIGLEVKTLCNMIKRELYEAKTEEEKIARQDLTGVQGWIIGYICAKSKEQDVFQKDIEKEFKIRRSTATGILQQLEKKGYIEKVSVNHDARLKKLVLTPKAIEGHSFVMERIQETERKLAKGLSEGEMLFFFEIMEKIKKNLEQ